MVCLHGFDRSYVATASCQCLPGNERQMAHQGKVDFLTADENLVNLGGLSQTASLFLRHPHLEGGWPSVGMPTCTAVNERWQASLTATRKPLLFSLFKSADFHCYNGWSVSKPIFQFFFLPTDITSFITYTLERVMIAIQNQRYVEHFSGN